MTAVNVETSPPPILLAVTSEVTLPDGEVIRRLRADAHVPGQRHVDPDAHRDVRLRARRHHGPGLRRRGAHERVAVVPDPGEEVGVHVGEWRGESNQAVHAGREVPHAPRRADRRVGPVVHPDVVPFEGEPAKELHPRAESPCGAGAGDGPHPAVEPERTALVHRGAPDVEPEHEHRPRPGCSLATSPHGKPAVVAEMLPVTSGVVPGRIGGLHRCDRAGRRLGGRRGVACQGGRRKQPDRDERSEPRDRAERVEHGDLLSGGREVASIPSQCKSRSVRSAGPASPSCTCPCTGCDTRGTTP